MKQQPIQNEEDYRAGYEGRYIVAQFVKTPSWFCHSLYTLGMEQVCRVAETAVKFKCKGQEARN